MLEELIISATNEAVKKSREAMAHEMKSLTGGIPGLDEMFRQGS
ncbi:MAG TPA: YbaB/EbfC family nucleoid-associated protein [Leptospiraceae bacterium]|nr:YbaB/EbfC family nucleoid-associated protein [Leptospiraceae bacterium]